MTRQITNLAPGTEASDAATVGQVASVGAVSAAAMGAAVTAAGMKGDNRVRLLGNEKPPAVLPMGVLDETIYTTQQDVLEEGDRLFLFTDGLRDLEGEAEVITEDACFHEIVSACAARCGSEATSGSFLDAILAAVKKEAGAKAFLDDVCLIEVELRRRV